MSHITLDREYNPLDLFTNPPVNQSLANKIDSFYAKDTQKKRMSQRERVFLTIKEFGVVSDREIAEFTGIARHLVPDRRRSWKDKIEFVEAKTDPITKRKVNYYKIAESENEES